MNTTLQIVAASIAILCVAWIVGRSPIHVDCPSGKRMTGIGRWKVRALVFVAELGLKRLLRHIDRPCEEVGNLRKLAIPTLHGPAWVTLYRPIARNDEVLPAYINFHGGGWVLGCPEQDDRICRYIANHARCIVVNVDYVRVPTCHFPGPVNQCLEVCDWVHRHASALSIDPAHIAVGGASAGGNLAAGVVAASLACSAYRFDALLLNVPVVSVEATMPVQVRTDRKQMINPDSFNMIRDAYVPHFADRSNPLASPIRADNLHQWPPTLIVNAEYDFLMPHGAALAEKLRDAGVQVTYRLFDGVDHSFTMDGPRNPAMQAWDLMVDTLRNSFASAKAPARPDRAVTGA